MSARTQNEITLNAELIGVRRSVPLGNRSVEIVRVCAEQRPGGPAENALLAVEAVDSRRKLARYISWIGYYDIEEAQAVEPGAWELVEPGREYRTRVEWAPFGWPDMQILPNH